uniref:Odorant binding protein n=1 Tax=Glyphodes pyloalis TaxID=1242752 RepID=A0A6M3GVD7_GLYPY|nr:odorant binding protein [Glyphodes pyloalis]
MKNFIFFVLGLSAGLVSSDPVSLINKCKQDDLKCLKESTRAFIPIFAGGIPEFNVETLDPVYFETIDSSSPSLRLNLYNVTVTELKKCIPKKIQHDLERSKLLIKLQCDGVLDGHYDMNGRLLILTISGNGKIHVDLRKAIFDLDIDMGTKRGKDGKNHWQIKSWKYTYDLKEKSTVYFENLLSGSPELAQAAQQVIAESGNEIIKEVGSPVLKAIIARVIENMSHMFRAVPEEDLAL